MSTQPNSEPPSGTSVLKSIRHFLLGLVDLREGLDEDGTVVHIKNNRRMYGANAWMLMCSIMIASLGLDLNSPAIIIGAMLISPLMSPILGVGLAVGTNDFETLRNSLHHFAIAIGIALATSILYFWLTPFGEATPEILSRTRPTLLDVLVALFGGTAGIISASRKDKSNAIPGVAIATALMPPLCVTGFGIAHGNGAIALNSFYLFFLNSFFIALSTYFIVRFLGFQQDKSLEDRLRKRKTWLMIGFTVLMVIPSGFILYGVWEEAKTRQNVEAFIQDHFSPYLLYVDDWDYVHGDSIDRIVVKMYGSDIDETALEDCAEAMERHHIRNARLDIIPSSEIDLDEIQSIETRLAQLTESRMTAHERDHVMDSLRSQITQLRSDTVDFNKVAQLLKATYPDLQSAAFAKAQITDFESYQSGQPLLIISWPRSKSVATRSRDEQRIRTFLNTYLEVDSVQIIGR